MNGKPPIVVYHVGAMGNWQEVVRQQMALLKDCGLAQALASNGESVRLTHVGICVDFVLSEAKRHNVPISVVRSDPNTDHYETFAMIEIDRLAKEENVNRPILYFHTKGVTAPHDTRKQLWRVAMENYVVREWRRNVEILGDGKDWDAIGWNWLDFGERHFSGNFWIALPSWIRKLPPYIPYHHAKGLVRFSCEMWIGAQAHPLCRAYSLGEHGRHWDHVDYAKHTIRTRTPSRKIMTTAAFCNWKTLKTGWGHMYPDHARGWEHWLIDCHYPIRREENLRNLKLLCDQHAVKWTDPGHDRGQADNFNFIMDKVGIDRDCLLTTVDPDSFIDGPADSLHRAAELLQANPRFAWVSLDLPVIRDQVARGEFFGTTAVCPTTGHSYFEPSMVAAMGITVWRGSFLVDVAGIHSERPGWGQVETPMYRLMQSRGMAYCYLLGASSVDDRSWLDPEYEAWKRAHWSGFDGMLEQWLKENA